MQGYKGWFRTIRAAILAVVAAALVMPPIPAAATVPSVRAEAIGTDNAVWATDGGGAAFAGSLGGQTTDAPAVYVTADGQFGQIVVGTDHDLYVMVDGNSGEWRHLSANRMWCQYAPSVTVNNGSILVGCIGRDNSVWVGQGGLPTGHSYPEVDLFFTLGGKAVAGPTVITTKIGTTTTLYVLALGIGHRVWKWDRSGQAPGWLPTPWKCNGHLASVSRADARQAFFACQGLNHAVWVAEFNDTTCTTFCDAQDWGGQAVDGPAITGLGTTVAAVYAEGTDGALWRATSPSNFTRVGGQIQHGAAAAATAY